MSMTEELFKAVANDTLRMNNGRANSSQLRTWKTFFGTTPQVAADIWNALHPTLKQGSQPKHLLWALLFLRKYNTERENCAIVGIQDEKTFREWCWYFIQKLSDHMVVVVRWENRFIGWNMRTKCLISIDGTDCPVEEPRPFDRMMFSQKINGPGFKYEIGLAIHTDKIVWINGPFKAGESDLNVFRQALSHILCDDEAVECDMYYKGDNRFKNPRVHQGRDDRLQKNKVRARHENVNSRIKQFKVLDRVFRHKQDLRAQHQLCFRAVITVVQMNLDRGVGSLPTCRYEVTYD